MVGSWWGVVIGAVAALLVAWIVLVAALAFVRPRDGLLSEALRILPDVLRLVRGWPPTPRCPAGSGSGSDCCWLTWPCRST